MQKKGDDLCMYSQKPKTPRAPGEADVAEWSSS